MEPVRAPDIYLALAALCDRLFVGFQWSQCGHRIFTVYITNPAISMLQSVFCERGYKNNEILLQNGVHLVFMQIIINNFKELRFASETSDQLHIKIVFADQFTKIVHYRLTFRII